MVFKNKLLLFTYSTPNIVGGVLGLSGLGLFFAGIIKSLWPFIVVGLYGIGYFATPRNEELHLSLGHRLDSETLAKSLEQLTKSVSRRLSGPVVERLNNLKQTMVEILPYTDKFSGTSYNLHAIKQTITDYLPDMLETYLQLPPAYARFHTMKNGLTPRDVLIEQLDLLDGEMKKTLDTILKNDTDQLLVQARFLKDKFSHGQDWLS